MCLRPAGGALRRPAAYNLGNLWRRLAGETCPLLLVALGGGSSDEAVVCQHAGADSWAAGSDGVARVGAVGNSIPRSRDVVVSEKTDGAGDPCRCSGLAAGG